VSGRRPPPGWSAAAVDSAPSVSDSPTSVPVCNASPGSAEASERAARIALSAVVDAGDPEASALIESRGPIDALRRIAAGALGAPLAERAARTDPAELWQRGVSVGARFVMPGDREWPDRLADLAHCEPIQRRGGVPVGLWLRGPARLDEVMANSVAIVGARACTPYGREVAIDLATELAERGINTLSGGAYGIDTAAHHGALAVGGSTLAVLACGVDVAYPSGNAGLFAKIAGEHLVVSELPPGEHPTRVRFLARNRVIAALTLGTVVVEAAIRSGARNTAGWAFACGRQVMAVPGPVSSAQSLTPHLLIRSGQASLVTCGADVAELVSPMGQSLIAVPTGAERPTDAMGATRLAVFEALPRQGWASPGELALRAGTSVPSCLAELAALERAGLVASDESGWRLVRAGHRQAGEGQLGQPPPSGWRPSDPSLRGPVGAWLVDPDG
jgi:DNA processing protein